MFAADINKTAVPKPALTFEAGGPCHLQNWDQACDIFQITV